MSKAFTKEENDQDDELPEGDDSALAALGTARNYMTPSCADRMKSELRKILTVDRPDLVKVISWAASNGDRSENGDYIYGKRKLRELDRRIRFLTKRLESAEIIDPTTQTADTVLFGATVHVLKEDGAKKVYHIVGIDETNVAQGFISWISPLGKALLNQKKGDVITFHAPRGEEELEVLKIEYIPLNSSL